MDGFALAGKTIDVHTLQGELEDRNTAEKPQQIVPTESKMTAGGDSLEMTFPALSFTVLRIE